MIWKQCDSTQDANIFLHIHIIQVDVFFLSAPYLLYNDPRYITVQPLHPR